MPVSGKGYALRNQLRCGSICGRYRGNNTLVKDSIGEAGAVVVADLLFGSASGGQTLTVSRLDNSQTFYPPTVNVGVIALTPDRFDNTSVFYSPSISQGGATQVLLPNLFTNSNVLYAPVVSVGVVSVTPNLFTNTQAFYSPTITQNISPGLFTNTNTFYSANVLGTQIVFPGLFTNTTLFYAPYVFDPAAVVSTIRYDISTGRLVKIINNYVCISL